MPGVKGRCITRGSYIKDHQKEASFPFIKKTLVLKWKKNVNIGFRLRCRWEALLFLWLTSLFLPAQDIPFLSWKSHCHSDGMMQLSQVYLHFMKSILKTMVIVMHLYSAFPMWICSNALYNTLWGTLPDCLMAQFTIFFNVISRIHRCPQNRMSDDRPQNRELHALLFTL